MPIVKKVTVITAISVLAACGSSENGNGGGNVDNSFDASVTVATASNGGDLTNAETIENNPDIVSDDVIVSVGGYAVSSAGAVDNAIASRTESGVTEVTLNGVTYTMNVAGTTSTNGELRALNDDILSGNSAATVLLATGTGLSDSSALPTEVYGYVRGLATPTGDIPGTGSTAYSGNTRLTQVGTNTVEDGTFDMTVPFNGDAISGSVASASITGSISAGLDGNAIEGTISSGASSDSLTLQGNLFGTAYQEFGGVASGDIGGTGSAMILYGTQTP